MPEPLLGNMCFHAMLGLEFLRAELHIIHRGASVRSVNTDSHRSQM